MLKVNTKYILMRVRQKISFYSFLKNATLSELWLMQIMKSFKFLSESA